MKFANSNPLLKVGEERPITNLTILKLRNGDASMVRIELISCLRNKVRETEQSQTTKERKGNVLGFSHTR